jgi:hypothetical protein
MGAVSVEMVCILPPSRVGEKLSSKTGHRPASGVCAQTPTSRFVDRAIDTTATGQLGVGGIDDGIYLEGGDVAADDPNSVRLRGRCDHG